MRKKIRFPQNTFRKAGRLPSPRRGEFPAAHPDWQSGWNGFASLTREAATGRLPQKTKQYLQKTPNPPGGLGTKKPARVWRHGRFGLFKRYYFVRVESRRTAAVVTIVGLSPLLVFVTVVGVLTNNLRIWLAGENTRKGGTKCQTVTVLTPPSGTGTTF